MKLTKNSPSSAFPKDLPMRIFAAVEADLNRLTTLGNSKNTNADLQRIVEKNLFPAAGVVEVPDNPQQVTTGREFVFFLAGALIASKIHEELDIALQIG